MAAVLTTISQRLRLLSRLAIAMVLCLSLGLTACSSSAGGLTGNYVEDTVAVADSLLATIALDADDPGRGEAFAEVGDRRDLEFHLLVVGELAGPELRGVGLAGLGRFEIGHGDKVRLRPPEVETYPRAEPPRTRFLALGSVLVLTPAVSEEVIQSRQNPRVQGLARLRDRAERDARRLFLVEGFRELTRALERGVKVDEVYFCPSMFRGSEAAELVTRARAAGIPCCELGVSEIGRAHV